jgi:molybdate transport system substrate-binding protein
MRGLPTITVLAASSLTEPITEIARTYSRKNNITVATEFGSTADQANSIEDGESADVFISGHPYWISELKKMGLLDVYSLTNLVKNKLVLVVSSSGRLSKMPIPTTNLSDKITFLNNRSIMSMGDPETSDIGLYTKQSLVTLDEKKGTKIWSNFNSKTIKSPNSKYNLYLISHGETAGITYYSEAYNNPEVQIIDTIDEKLHDPIIYQAAVVAGENMTNARSLLEFLQSAEAKLIFKKYGFGVD